MSIMRLFGPARARPQRKGQPPKAMHGTHRTWVRRRTGTELSRLFGCVALCGMQCYIILHLVPVFKPVFLLSANKNRIFGVGARSAPALHMDGNGE